MEQLLPPGFRFYPTEEELISFYLHHKLHSLSPELDRVIPSIDFYSFEPSQLPGLAGELCNEDTEQWFFFSRRQEREARGGRPSRTTAFGYWKATGSPTYVYSSENNKVIGMKKTMVFYKGKAPTGRKTKWKMNEYKAIKLHQHFLNSPKSSSASAIPELRHEWSLCRVYITSGCARAFDRRPPGRILSICNADAQNAIASSSKDQEVQTVAASLQNDVKNASATFLMEKSSSSSAASSNSGGNYLCILHPDKEATATAKDRIEIMADDDLQTFSDLEQLNWL